MCGICFVLSTKKEPFNFEYWLNSTGLKSFLQSRGPDSFEIISQSFEKNETKFNLYASASVLSMRGLYTVEQPVTNEHSDFLLFNGEIYDGLDLAQEEYLKVNDALILFEKLSNLSTDKEILNFVSNLQGPRSFIYFRNESKKLYIHRDTFGRCSLVWTIDEYGTFYCSSIKPPNVSSKLIWKEIPAGILCSVDLNSFQTCPQTIITNFNAEEDGLQINLFHYFGLVNLFQLNSNENLLKLNNNTENVINFNENHTAESLFIELSRKYEKYVEEFLHQLRMALKRRLNCMLTCLNQRQAQTTDTNLAILFSGGVDSLLLTALANEIWPEDEPLDLLNVAFEQTSANKFDVPDRKTGLKSLEELKNCSNIKRKWNFIEINVTREELSEMRKEKISHLIYPCHTVLDDSIGCSLWFASRGIGMVHNQQYASAARAVVVGSGADELLGGYSRHRATFEKKGLAELIKELENELKRIPYRNLGRDDRVIADHGREPHAPYLDENFVEYCNSLPIYVKANLHLPRGIGEKLILRLALWKLGFRQAAAVPKRAMQFGTRIAKSENKNERGSDMCSRLTIE